jgi:hypothetical protein
MTIVRSTKSEAEELLRQRKLGFSFVRLLPKETGVRPIVNLRRRKPTKPVCSPSPRWPYTTDGQLQGAYGPAEQSINQILQAAFHILTFEKVSAVLHIILLLLAENTAARSKHNPNILGHLYLAQMRSIQD